MAGLRPTKAFADAALDLASVGAGERFFRIYPDRYPDPLGYGKSPSRFSDPRRRPDHGRFGVLYLGASLKVCFVEAVLRDRRNGAVGDYPIEENELARFAYAEVAVVGSLSLVDLRRDGPIRMGVPSDVASASAQRLARDWSVAFHDHPRTPDGIIYHSRLNQEVSLAIYDRAIGKLSLLLVSPLLRAPGFSGLLNDLNVALA
jgi:hypothetical protein